jgi:amino acid transporter
MAITFGILASIFLILLSCFDASNYKREHWIFAGVAFSSLITSLAFNLAQNVVLRRQHRAVKALRRTIIVKSTAFAGAVLCIVVMFALQAMCAGQETTE